MRTGAIIEAIAGKCAMGRRCLSRLASPTPNDSAGRPTSRSELFETVEEVTLDTALIAPPSLSYIRAHRLKAHKGSNKDGSRPPGALLTPRSAQEYLADSPVMKYAQSEKERRHHGEELVSAEGSFLSTWLRK